MVIRAALLLAALTTVAGATDEEILGENEDQGWTLKDFRLGFTYLDQRGRGHQSQANKDAEQRGDERLTVISPTLYALIEQSPTVRHHVFVPVDLVTTASANALDAISTASAVTEAGNIDVTTEIDAAQDVDVNLHYGIHVEEPMTSLNLGAGTALHLAEDNTVLEIDLAGLVDIFDPIGPDGRDPGLASKKTFSANGSISQILSPTTIAWLSYGFTYQAGTLETTYNAVPTANGRIGEKFPSTRKRNAWSLRVAQMIPLTGSTLRANYRFYLDDIGIRAHTIEGELYQRLTDSVLIQGSYRFHRQSAAEFYTEGLPAKYDTNIFRTADSDLAAFDAHEVGGRILLFFGSGSSDALNFGYSRYWRPRLVIDSVELSYASVF